MELLLYLASRPRQVIPRAEILAAVWNGRYVAAQALNHAVWELRRALGDDARRPRYIETVTKRGYRMVAKVEPLAAPVESLAAPGRTAVSGPSTAPPPAPILGVAPWRDFSSPADRAVFCDAMTELLTTLLAQVDALEVVLLGDRAESAAAGRGERPLDAVVEGSALVGADRVRMTARLVAAGGKHLWAGAYDRELTDVLRLQSEVVEEVVRQIERRLGVGGEPGEG